MDKNMNFFSKKTQKKIIVVMAIILALVMVACLFSGMMK